MKHRIILHIDMDAFFPAIEERENPRFKETPLIVGADPRGGRGRGVVSSASYLARKFGIKSGMPISKAYQLCPDAIFLPVNMEFYEKVSENIMEIIKKYSPQWEIASLDEAYLDLTSFRAIARKPVEAFGWEKAKNLAKKLKKEIFEKEKLTATVGIGPNKLIAKMAAQRAKPNGLLIIKPNQARSFLEPLDAKDLPGIGPKTAEKLKVLKINKIQELKKLSKTKLKNMFGIAGERIYQRVRGIDQEEVSSEEIIKSIGREHTFEKDTRNPKIIFETFEKMIKNIHRELLSNNFSFRTVTVICRFSNFETHTKSKTLKSKSCDLEILNREAKKLLLKFIIESTKLIRLVGVRVNVV